jgi:hypothetical protein
MSSGRLDSNALDEDGALPKFCAEVMARGYPSTEMNMETSAQAVDVDGVIRKMLEHIS